MTLFVAQESDTGAGVIDTESDPGAWADAIAHSPCMAVSDYVPADDAGTSM
jgi:hypothetical protein